MTFLVAWSRCQNTATIREDHSELWRQIRRFNPPVQMALAAAEEVVPFAQSASRALLVSLAPCQSGSLELIGWVHKVAAKFREGGMAGMRMNPTHTLHAVDNLALSAFAIAHRNQSHCLGFGGAAGQAWCALEMMMERLERGLESEAILLAGDQDPVTIGKPAPAAMGLALLFSKEPRINPHGSRTLGLEAIDRAPVDRPGEPVAHAAQGLNAWVETLASTPKGSLSYKVPREHANGMERVTLRVSIT